MTGKLVFPLSAEKRAQQEAQQRALAKANAQKAAAAKRDADARRLREAAQAEQQRREQAQAHREAARCDAIMGSPYAKDDPMLALELAYQSSMSSTDAIETMRTHAEAKRSRSWGKAMARAQSRAWESRGEPASGDASGWDRAMRKVSR
jgi:hypothetical protein